MVKNVQACWDQNFCPYYGGFFYCVLEFVGFGSTVYIKNILFHNKIIIYVSSFLFDIYSNINYNYKVLAL